MMTTPCQHQNLRESYYGYTCTDCGEFYCAYGQEPWADGDDEPEPYGRCAYCGGEWGDGWSTCTCEADDD